MACLRLPSPRVGPGGVHQIVSLQVGQIRGLEAFENASPASGHFWAFSTLPRASRRREARVLGIGLVARKSRRPTADSSLWPFTRRTWLA